MSNFISKIKKIRTDELIYVLSDISIKMYKDNMSFTKNFPVYVNRFGFYEEKQILLTAWDIPSIEYFSVINSTDYRNGDTISALPELINLYRKYEDMHSTNQIKDNDGNDIFKIIMGKTSEQFQFQKPHLMFEKLNRTYHILISAKNYEHRNELDVNAAIRSNFDFSAEEYLIILFMVFWLCTQHPDPLTALEHIYKKKELTVFTKENITKFVEKYSCTYDDLRKSPMQKQLLYSKPFIKTKRDNLYLSSSVYMVEFLLGNGLYWLVRDYYRNDGQRFPNAFGLLFEDYIKELAATYCKPDEWHVIPKGEEKGADYIFRFDSLQIIVESKSSLLKLDAKQQIPNLDSTDTFFNKAIKESYEQLSKSYEQYKNKVKTPTIKVILLYDEFSNISIIEKSIPEIFEQDLNCFIMTIRQLEILLYLHKKDADKFNLLIDKIIKSVGLNGEKFFFDAIFDELSIYENPHFSGSLDYVESLLQRFDANLYGGKSF